MLFVKFNDYLPLAKTSSIVTIAKIFGTFEVFIFGIAKDLLAGKFTTSLVPLSVEIWKVVALICVLLWIHYVLNWKKTQVLTKSQCQLTFCENSVACDFSSFTIFSSRSNDDAIFSFEIVWLGGCNLVNHSFIMVSFHPTWTFRYFALQKKQHF